MNDTRKKNADWLIRPNLSGAYTDTLAALAILMDIRDELQTLNAVFRCSNFLALSRDIKRTRILLAGISRDALKKPFRRVVKRRAKA